MDLEDWQRTKYWKADNQHVLSENYQQTEIGAGNCSQIHSVTHLKTLFVNTGNKEMAVNHCYFVKNKVKQIQLISFYIVCLYCIFIAYDIKIKETDNNYLKALT